jgi:hypothetical protein
MIKISFESASAVMQREESLCSGKRAKKYIVKNSWKTSD